MTLWNESGESGSKLRWIRRKTAAQALAAQGEIRLFIGNAEIRTAKGKSRLQQHVNLHIAGKGMLYQPSLNDLAGRLDPMRFIRVHRSAIVNIEGILHLEPITHGALEAVLKDGSQPRISRTFRAQLEKRLGQSL